MAAGSLRLALLLRLTRGRALTDGLPGLGGVLPGHCSVSDGSNSEKCCGFSKYPTFVSKSTQGWWVGPFRCRVRRRPRPSLSIGRSVSERASEGVAVVAVVSVSRTNKRDHKPRASASE